MGCEEGRGASGDPFLQVCPPPTAMLVARFSHAAPVARQTFFEAAAGGQVNHVTQNCAFPPCLGAATCMTGCGNITERVVRTCCAPGECGRNCNGMSEAQCTGADGCRCVPDPAHPGGCRMPFRCVAEDPYPATCSLVGGCADAVIAGALEVCPAAFVENPRMFGLYADCTEGPTQINGHQSAAAKWHLSAHPIDDLMQAYNAGGWPNTPLRLRQRKGPADSRSWPPVQTTRPRRRRRRRRPSSRTATPTAPGASPTPSSCARLSWPSACCSAPLRWPCPRRRSRRRPLPPASRHQEWRPRPSTTSL